VVDAKEQGLSGVLVGCFLLVGFLSSLIWLLLGGGSMSTYLALFFAINLILFQGVSRRTGFPDWYGAHWTLWHHKSYGVASFLGDVLSYSRLMALNLTGHSWAGI